MNLRIKYFHVYEFNRHELDNAKRFAEQNNLIFHAYYAFFNGINSTLNYLEGTLPKLMLTKAKSMLYLNYFSEMKGAIPDDYVCPQQKDYLTIDEDCNVLTCCAIEKGQGNYSIGSLFEMTALEIQEKKLSQPICSTCLGNGIPYIYDHLPRPYEA